MQGTLWLSTVKVLWYLDSYTCGEMAILPLSAPPTPNNATSFPKNNVSARMPLIFRRLHRFHQMASCLKHWVVVLLITPTPGLRTSCMAAHLPLSRTETSVRVSSYKISRYLVLKSWLSDIVMFTSTNVCLLLLWYLSLGWGMSQKQKTHGLEMIQRF